MSSDEEDTKNRDDDASAAGGGASRSMPLLEKIKHTLASTPPERWEQGGEELDSSRRYQKPREFWEELYCTDVKTGVLVLRRSTPITTNFFGGGYTFVEASDPIYTIELRGRGWAPKMLVDPAFRTAGGVDKNFQVLADGKIARQLYQEVEILVRNYRESQRRDFNDSVQRLMANLHEQVSATSAEDWQSVEGEEKGYTGYTSDINGMTVLVSCVVRDRTAGYSMRLTKYGLRWDCRDTNLMKEIFSLVDESVRAASLEKLGKALEDIL